MGGETVLSFLSEFILAEGRNFAVEAFSSSIYSVTFSVSHHRYLNLGSTTEAITKQSSFSYIENLEFMDFFRVVSIFEL